MVIITTLTVTVTQVNSGINNLHSYQETIREIVSTAKNEGAALVLLPQYTGCLWQQLKHGINSFSELLQRHPDGHDFLEFHSGLAREKGLFLALGTHLEKEGEKVFHTGYLISNKGHVILRQKQTHLSKTEQQWKLSRGTETEVVATDIGRIGLVVGTDRYYPEVSRIVALQGAELVLYPGGEFESYNFYRQVAGTWREVQQNQFYGLESCFRGPVLDREVDGRPWVLAPCDLTSGETGFMVSPEEDTSIRTCQINLANLAVSRRKFPVFRQFNVPLYQKVFPRVYETPVSESLSENNCRG